jgi:hypothetical protein
MAYEVIHTFLIDEYIQEEVKEVDEFEVETIVTPYARLWSELVVSQERLTAENTSRFKAYLKIGCTLSQECEETTVNIWGNSGDNTIRGFGYYSKDTVLDEFTVSSGTTKLKTIRVYDSTDTDMFRGKLIGYHNLDGTLTGMYCSPNSGDNVIKDLVFSGSVDCFTTGGFKSSIYTKYEKTIYPLSIERGIVPTIADNFTDEDNPSITYSVVSSDVCARANDGEWFHPDDTILLTQAAISLDGVNPDIEFRDIPSSGTYTFELTDSDRELLRQKVQGAASVPVYYMFKTVRALDSKYYPYAELLFETQTQRVLTIVGSTPILNPTVIDIKPETIALTGNANIFVRYESMIEFSTGAVASKHASIVSQSVQCGSKTIYNLYNGVIDDIESGEFIFNASDSRGLNADTVVINNVAMIDYVKPSCKQEVSIEMSGETGAVVTIKLSGNYYNGSFGAVDNTLQLAYKIEDGAWNVINKAPVYKGNTYELTTTITGLSYAQAYTFQCRAIDKLNTVNTAQYTIRLMPVFDWSETDFNFNVPVNIDGSLDMYGNTIIRHNKDANNTVLSANGGRIYIRPNGTEETTGETIFYPNGDIAFGSNLDAKTLSINGNDVADYVIETGTAEMGSNGTWYWQKWASGKSECWGCRNFGNMAVTTAWGGLYRSAILTQDLPEDVFITTPDVININIVNGNFGGWICKHENLAPSAVTTGSFIFVRPASATVTPTYIGFNVIGVWKQ